MASEENPKGKILVLDDEKHIVMYLETLLKDNGYETIAAYDGEKALALVREEKPALIILDLMMPKKTGTDFYRRLSRDKDVADTPVIVVSALPGRELAVRNPAAVFGKPIVPEEFLAAVAKVLSGPA